MVATKASAPAAASELCGSHLADDALPGVGCVDEAVHVALQGLADGDVAVVIEQILAAQGHAPARKDLTRFAARHPGF